MHLIRVSPTMARKPDLIDRQVNEKYDLRLDLDRPKDPAETQRVAAGMFCESVSPQRLAVFMRDRDLQNEFRELLAEVQLVREIFQEKQPAFIGLIDTDPPALRAVAQKGPVL